MGTLTPVFMIRSIFSMIMAMALIFLSPKNGIAQYYNAIEWGTYLNDNEHFPAFNYANDDLVDQVATNKKDPEAIYVVGKTFATNNQQLSVCSGNNTIALGGGNGYLAKFDECGELVWSTFIGDYASSLAVDEENGKTIIYVAGRASSDGAPAFNCDGSGVPVFQPEPSDNSDGFIAKYADKDTAVELLRWTYFGGSFTTGTNSTDDVFAIAVFNHNVFVTGNTHSNNLYKGALHTGKTVYGGGGDAYIAWFDSLLSKLIFFTYVGTGGNDRCHDIDVIQSASGKMEIFISGTSSSSTGIASGTGFDQTYNGDTDLFLSKWEDVNGNGLLSQTWGTYLGGSSNEHGRQMEVDENGNIYITGYGSSKDLPVTSFAYDQHFGSTSGTSTGGDCYIYKIGNDGSNQWCTYLGGNKDEIVNGLALMKNESGQYVVIAGFTKSLSNKFKLINPIQSLLNGTGSNQYYDGFISVLSDVSNVKQQLVFSTYIGGSNEDAAKPGQPHPGIAIGKHNELYFATPVRSADINEVMGNGFDRLVHPYNGGIDAFIAKLIDTDNPDQPSCGSFKLQDEFFDNEDLLPLNIYPNPFSDGLVASFFSQTQEPAYIKVTSVFGKTIFNGVVQIKNGENKIHVDLEDAVAGVYLVTIVQGKNLRSGKAAKLNF